MEQILYLMVGYPGAGKTTAAKEIAKVTGAVHIWADFERRKKNQQPTYSPEETKKLYEQLNELTKDLLKDGKSVVYDTNFNFLSDRIKLSLIAQKYNVKTIVIWVTTDKNTAKNRAVFEAHKHSTRILGSMPVEHFERIAKNQQSPTASEPHILIDGTKINSEYIKKTLEKHGVL